MSAAAWGVLWRAELCRDVLQDGLKGGGENHFLCVDTRGFSVALLYISHLKTPHYTKPQSPAALRGAARTADVDQQNKYEHGSRGNMRERVLKG